MNSLRKEYLLKTLIWGMVAVISSPWAIKGLKAFHYYLGGAANG